MLVAHFNERLTTSACCAELVGLAKCDRCRHSEPYGPGGLAAPHIHDVARPPAAEGLADDLYHNLCACRLWCHGCHCHLGMRAPVKRNLYYLVPANMLLAYKDHFGGKTRLDETQWGKVLASVL